MEKQFHFYYDPEKAGVEQIWLHDNYNPEEDYSYDIIALYQEKKTKKLYWGITQGCSCNSPFEDETLDDLTELTPKQYLFHVKKLPVGLHRHIKLHYLQRYID